MMTLDDIAKELRVSRRTIYRWIQKGKLKALRLDGIYRVEEKAYQEFIERGRQVSNSGSDGIKFERVGSHEERRG